MAEIKQANDLQAAQQALAESDRIGNNVRQMAVQMGQMATQFLALRAQAKDSDDNAVFDARLQAAIDDAKATLDALPPGPKAVAVQFLNGLLS